MNIRLPFQTALLACVAFAGGCEQTPTRAEGLASGAARFDIMDGSGQQAPAGSELPRPLVVRVMAGEVPIANQIVNFVVTAGGGRMYAGTALTNASGIAQDYWTLGETIGSTQEVQVRAVDPVTGSPVVYGSFTAIAQGAVESVIVTPDSTNVEETHSAQLSATLLDEGGRVLSDRTVTWSSSDPLIATVDANGLMQARAAGAVTIRASIDDRFGESRITIVSPASSGYLVPAIPDLQVGTTYQTIVLDGNGQGVSANRVRWESSNTKIATVGADGLVTGRSTGEAIITAVVDGQRAGASVRVRPRSRK